jgi:hypothetical protein
LDRTRAVKRFYLERYFVLVYVDARETEKGRGGEREEEEMWREEKTVEMVTLGGG